MLLKNSTFLKKFSATELVGSVAIDIIRELIHTKCGNMFLSEIIERFKKTSWYDPTKACNGKCCSSTFIKPLGVQFQTTKYGAIQKLEPSYGKILYRGVANNRYENLLHDEVPSAVQWKSR